MSDEKSDIADRLLIPIRPEVVGAHDLDATAIAVRQVVRSVRFEIINNRTAIRLLGPDMGYHKADPHIERGLASIGYDGGIEGLQGYRDQREFFDLACEDSWTGYFMAKSLAHLKDVGEVLVVHLDDHVDMMPTLLYLQDGQMADCSNGRPFETLSTTCWAKAIQSGAVSIGNYLTPFFHAARRIHVRHLWNATDRTGLQYVRPTGIQYPLIPDKAFAALDIGPTCVWPFIGTYLADSDPETLLSNAPRATAIVHVDLDYFINDFNGAHLASDYVPDSRLLAAGLEKMARFFGALDRSKIRVDRWIIATSPGFCCALHWRLLLDALENGISRINSRRTSG